MASTERPTADGHDRSGVVSRNSTPEEADAGNRVASYQGSAKGSEPCLSRLLGGGRSPGPTRLKWKFRGTGKAPVSLRTPMRNCPVGLNRKRELASISRARTAAFDPPVAADAIPDRQTSNTA